MNRKVKSLVATIVCLVMTTVILGGCTASNGNTGNNTTQKQTSTETPTETVEPDQQNSTVDPVTIDSTEDPVTTDSTEVPTATAEPQKGEVIIPLFPEENSDQVHQIDPMELITFSEFYKLFNICGSGKMDQGAGGIELLTNDYLKRGYEVSNSPSSSSRTTHTIMIYIRQSMNNQIVNNPDGPLTFVYYIDDVEVLASGRFIPLYYNETKQCFIGYWFNLNLSTGEAESYTLDEWYYNGSSTPKVGVVDVSDPSLYGF